MDEEQVISQLESYSLKKNDLLLIKVSQVSGRLHDLVKKLAEKYKRLDLSVVILPNDSSLEVIPEEEMIRAGWVRSKKSRLPWFRNLFRVD